MKFPGMATHPLEIDNIQPIFEAMREKGDEKFAHFRSGSHHNFWFLLSHNF